MNRQNGKLLIPETGALSNLPRLFISQENMDIIFGLALNSPDEVNGRGLIERVGNDYVVTDEVFMIPQKASRAHVGEDEEGYHELLFNRFQDNLHALAKLNFQFHSHPDKVFFSGRDRENARALGINPLISMVVNKEFDVYCRLDIFNPDLSLEIPVFVTHKIPEAIMDFCQQEIQKNTVIKSNIITTIGGMIFGKKETPVKDIPVKDTAEVAVGMIEYQVPEGK